MVERPSWTAVMPSLYSAAWPCLSPCRFCVSSLSALPSPFEGRPERSAAKAKNMLYLDTSSPRRKQRYAGSVSGEEDIGAIVASNMGKVIKTGGRICRCAEGVKSIETRATSLSFSALSVFLFEVVYFQALRAVLRMENRYFRDEWYCFERGFGNYGVFSIFRF